MIQISLWKNTSDSKKKKLEDKVEHLIDKLPDATFSREPTTFKNSENEFRTIVYNDLKSKSDPLNEPSRLEMIWGRPVNRVHVLDFARLTDGMRQTVGDRLSTMYVGDDGEALFTSHAWRRLLKVRGPRRMTWRQFILALGFHFEEELMDASGRTYQAFDSTLVRNSRLSYERCVKPRTGDASTSVAPQTDDQPDP
nr:hypothetical protein [Tanacetum cinerariifolium]